MFTTPKQTPAEQYVLATVLTLIATVFVVLRFMARRVRRNRIELDDWLIVFALVFTYVTAVFMIVGTAKGNQGQHMDFDTHGQPILNERYIWFLKMLYAGQLSQMLAIGPTKISMLLLYRRIFRGKIFDYVTYTLIILVSVWTVAFFFANMFECVPISESWKNAPGLGGNPHCIDAIPMYLSQVYSDVILDAMILVVPIPLIWKLRLPTKQKIAVSSIFLIGILSIAASCAKMIVFNFVGHQLEGQPDVSYFLTPIVYWPLIEANLQIMAACMAMLRPLFIQMAQSQWYQSLRRSLGSRDSGYTKSYDDQRTPINDNSDLSNGYEGRLNPGLENNTREANVEHLPLGKLNPARLSDGILVEREFAMTSDKLEM
ncbi:hypothetical protein HYFRA_00003750 [Hymenoscyphus fraxineus]|uniref:Rhodopsin domain-containing protein n=1 Tax=Hymenoscyphus fraxineus TaxID=746836 RepID=A0A9N9L1C1_9HELO|nr:hypothetical protein HYFRA_00003750 [Hymenoscyphus fraxineus]